MKRNIIVSAIAMILLILCVFQFTACEKIVSSDPRETGSTVSSETEPADDETTVSSQTEPGEFETTVNSIINTVKNKSSSGIYVNLFGLIFGSEMREEPYCEYSEDDTYIYVRGGIYGTNTAFLRKDTSHDDNIVYLSDGETSAPVYEDPLPYFKQNVSAMLRLISLLDGNGEKFSYQIGTEEFPALSFIAKYEEYEVEITFIDKNGTIGIVLDALTNGEGMLIIREIGDGSTIPASIKSTPDKLKQNRMFFCMRSDSMSPAIRAGDWLLLDTDVSDKTFSVGDIIAISFNNEVGTFSDAHRIFEVTEQGYRTQGDYFQIPDDSIVTKEQIIGKVLEVYDQE